MNESYEGGNNYKIKVLLADDNLIYDMSDEVFALTGEIVPQLTVTSPNGGEIWQVGTNYDITWTSYNVSGLIRIQLYRNNEFFLAHI